MGQKLTGIVIQKKINQDEIISLFEINKKDIITSEKTTFETISGDFMNDKNIGICSTDKGTYISCSTQLICEIEFLKTLSLDNKVITFYSYDTTSTYCLDVYEKGIHKTHLWSSTDKNFNPEDKNFGYNEELNTPNKVNEHILQLIKDATNISFNITDLKRESFFIDYTPEGYLEIPLQKKQVHNYVLKKFDDFFIPLGFKYIKTCNKYVLKNKEYEIEFSLYEIKETFKNIKDRSLGVEFGPSIKIINKSLRKEVAKIENCSIPHIRVSLFDLYSKGNDYSFKDYFFSNKEELDYILELITKPVIENKIFGLINTFSNPENIKKLYIKSGINGHKYLPDFRKVRLKEGLTIAKLINDKKLIEEYEYELI